MTLDWVYSSIDGRLNEFSHNDTDDNVSISDMHYEDDYDIDSDILEDGDESNQIKNRASTPHKALNKSIGPLYKFYHK